MKACEAERRVVTALAKTVYGVGLWEAASVRWVDALTADEDRARLDRVRRHIHEEDGHVRVR